MINRKKLPINTKRRITYKLKSLIIQSVITLSIFFILLIFEEKNLIKFSPPLWHFTLLLSITYIFFMLQNFYLHISNRYEILYIMKYDTKGAEPQNYQEGWSLALSNQKRLQHLISHYLYGHYDLVGLIPPARSKYEEIGIKSDIILPEARYLLKTINDAEWKESINTIILNAKVVIIECSEWSESLAWEITQAIKIKGTKNIILVANEKDKINAKKVKSKILKLIQQITNKNFKLRVLLHQKTTFGKADTKFKNQLTHHIERISPPTKNQKRKMIFIAHLRLGLGYVWMFSIIILVIYFLKAVF